jgi:acetylornithine deacetylase/succinyl-diaminopimelate desuccinylase-like protein
MGERLLGSRPEEIVAQGRRHLRWRLGPAGAPHVLILAHYDTVWPVGSWGADVCQVTGSGPDARLAGPGCFDMKAGLTMAFHALAGLGTLVGAAPGVTLHEGRQVAGEGNLLAGGSAGCGVALREGGQVAGERHLLAGGSAGCGVALREGGQVAGERNLLADGSAGSGVTLREGRQVAGERHLLADGSAGSGVTLLVTADEEEGAPSSRGLIEAEAAGAIAALVPEAPAPGGALKTARKGVSLYRLRAVGRAAHAGLEPERGINASVELAHAILALVGLADAGRGTSVTPTAVRSGTTTNTVPAAGDVAVDVRVWSAAEQDRVDRAIRALRPVTPGAALEVDGGPNRAPLEASASAELFALARDVAGALPPNPWLDFDGASVGGASDGNFTAGLGVPTLDGLGAVGGGAHAADEHILLASLEPRTALLQGLVARLVGPASSIGSIRK